MFLPTTREEMARLGWKELDVILVTGDAYIDSPYTGAVVIGRVLVDAGYKVGIIAQPDTKSNKDICRLGEPALFWGVTAGAVDSMVANYTPLKKPRRSDDFTPGGRNSRRPDRACIAYANLIRRYFKNTRPIILGGIEASLRRIAHYDYWDDSIRRSILVDAKADILVYAMGEKSTLELADKLRKKQDYWDIRGICYIAPQPKEDYLMLPSYQEVKTDKHKFTGMFNIFYANNDPITAKGLCQKQDTRYLIQNPPAEHLSTAELDRIYELNYEHAVHPYYAKQGAIKALETIKFSITSHRGCYGECNFCAIAVHQGRRVISRSPESILREAEQMARRRDFKGNIRDIGGPTANMYGTDCPRQLKAGPCPDKRCLYPEPCKALRLDHKPQIELLRKLRALKGVQKVFIGSGIRHDMIIADTKHGPAYLAELVNHHISGQLKIAPEHTEDRVLNLMCKTGQAYLREFKSEFDRLNKKSDRKQFLTYYFIAGHPGCKEEDMRRLQEFIRKELRMTPEQVQIFTPTPSTYSTLMYYTGVNPFSGQPVFVEKDNAQKDRQKQVIVN